MAGGYDGEVKIGTRIDLAGILSGATTIRAQLGIIGKQCEEVGKLMSLALTAPIAIVGTLAVKSAMAMETAQVSFEVMLGSATKASALLKDLQAFASTTPFEFQGLADSSKTLLQFGISGDKVMTTIKMLGDVALGDSQKLSQLSLVFGQIQSTGRLMGQDLLQLINVGFNPLSVISKETGRSMADLKKDMEKGAISADMVTKAFKSATSEGGLFYKGMEKLGQTTEGLLSTMKDDAATLARSFGDMLLPAIKDVLKGLSGFFQQLNSLDSGTKQTIINMALVAAAIGPVVFGIGKISSALNVLKAHPLILGLSLLIEGITLLSGVIGTADQQIERMVESYEKLNEGINTTRQQAADVIGPITDMNRNQALNETQVAKLIKLYPTLEGEIKKYGATLETVAKAADKLTIAQKGEAIVGLITQKQSIDAQKKQLEAQNKQAIADIEAKKREALANVPANAPKEKRDAVIKNINDTFNAQIDQIKADTKAGLAAMEARKKTIDIEQKQIEAERNLLLSGVYGNEPYGTTPTTAPEGTGGGGTGAGGGSEQATLNQAAAEALLENAIEQEEKAIQAVAQALVDKNLALAESIKTEKEAATKAAQDAMDERDAIESAGNEEALARYREQEEAAKKAAQEIADAWTLGAKIASAAGDLLASSGTGQVGGLFDFVGQIGQMIPGAAGAVVSAVATIGKIAFEVIDELAGKASIKEMERQVSMMQLQKRVIDAKIKNAEQASSKELNNINARMNADIAAAQAAGASEAQLASIREGYSKQSVEAAKRAAEQKASLVKQQAELEKRIAIAQLKIERDKAVREAYSIWEPLYGNTGLTWNQVRIKEQFDALIGELEQLGITIEDTAETGTDFAGSLSKIQSKAEAFAESMKDVGDVIADNLISAMQDGLTGDDFLYSLQEYIRNSVIEAAVYTDSLKGAIASIGARLGTAILGGADSTTLASIRAELMALFESANAAAQSAGDIVDTVFGSYAIGTLSVKGDQLAKIHDDEMILPKGISDEARMAGISIAPINSRGMAPTNGVGMPEIKIDVTATGTIVVDGREIGKIAFDYSDQMAKAAYGD